MRPSVQARAVRSPGVPTPCLSPMTPQRAELPCQDTGPQGQIGTPTTTTRLATSLPSRTRWHPPRTCGTFTPAPHSPQCGPCPRGPASVLWGPRPPRPSHGSSHRLLLLSEENLRARPQCHTGLPTSPTSLRPCPRCPLNRSNPFSGSPNSRLGPQCSRPHYDLSQVL